MAATERIEADVAIIGAGPSGAAAAAHLGQLGVKNVVLVDRADFPRDKTCGSGISPKGLGVLRELGVWEQVEPHAYWIKGIRVVTPGDRESWQSAGDEVQAAICQRRVLDHLLLKRALDGGVRFIPNFTATEILREGDRAVGFVDRAGREIRARYTVVAGGSHCRVGMEGKLRPRRTIQAIMGWWEGVPFRPHHLEMLFDKMVAPYYGWLFPESETRVNIGITYEHPRESEGGWLRSKGAAANGSGANGTGKKNARALFQQFLDKHYADRLRGAKQLGPWRGHPIVYSYDIRELTAPGRVIIGEAGLMTHPATAEGIYHGMRSGMLAAQALRDVLVRGRHESVAFAEYERQCRRAFQLSFWGGALFRAAVKSPVLDWLVRASEQPVVQSAAAKLMARM